MDAVDGLDIHQYAIHTRDSGCFLPFSAIGGYFVKVWQDAVARQTDCEYASAKGNMLTFDDGADRSR